MRFKEGKDKRKGESRKNNLVLFDKRSNSTINEKGREKNQERINIFVNGKQNLISIDRRKKQNHSNRVYKIPFTKQTKKT